jgi:hypothetical protein
MVAGGAGQEDEPACQAEKHHNVNPDVSESSGMATLTFVRLKKSLPMSQFGDVLASDAAAGVVCANNGLTVTLHYIRLEFSKL